MATTPRVEPCTATPVINSLGVPFNQNTHAGCVSMSTTITADQETVLAFIAKAPHLPDMPAEFWHMLANMRAQGLVEFRFGHWVASAERPAPAKARAEPVQPDMTPAKAV